MEKRVGALAVLIIIIIAMGGIALVLFSEGAIDETTGEATPSLYQQLTQEKPEPPSTSPTIDASQTGGGGGGGDSAGGGGGSPSTTGPVCSTIEITYSLRNFEDYIECAAFNASTCTDLSVNCTVGVHNIETVGDGSFDLQFDLRDKNTNIIIDTQNVINTVNAKTGKTFIAEFLLSNNSGVPTNVDCKIQVNNKPTATICV